MQNNPEWAINFIMKKTGLDKAIATEEYNNTIKGLSADGMFSEAWVAESLKLATLAGMKDIPSATSMMNAKFVPVKTVAP
jgi:NitT/TauT family transport system substrate-binding protein